LRSPRLVELLLDRVTSETLKWNVNIPRLDVLAVSLEDSANRLSFSILVGSLIMGAAIIATGSPTSQVSVVSNVLFAAASLLGLWLILSILRSGKLK
jgi:ubiquinone biosynthesis protein